MHRSRHRARILTSSKSSNGRNGRMNVCMLAGSFLLLGAVALLQLRLTVVGKDLPDWPDEVYKQLHAVNDSHCEGQGSDGKSRSWSGKCKEWGQTFGRLWKSNIEKAKDTSSFEDEINGETNHLDGFQSMVEEEERFDDVDNDMDMEDEDVDEFGGGTGDWVNEVDEFLGKEKQTSQAEKRDLIVEQKETALSLRVISTGPGVSTAEAVGESIARDGKSDTPEKSGTEETMFKPTFFLSQSNGNTDLSLNQKDRTELRKLKEDAIGRSLGLQPDEKVGSKNIGLQDEVRGDYSRGAFSTDDEPINEDTRNRLERMLNIEDALMINIGTSSKKESWGKIQDGKSSKKEAKVSSDPLNPANNPLLQDPDTFGESALTQNDKAFRKSFRWINAKGQYLLVGNNSYHFNEKHHKEPIGGSKIHWKVAVWNASENQENPLENEHRKLDAGILPGGSLNRSAEQLTEILMTTELLQSEEHMDNSFGKKSRVDKLNTITEASEGKSLDIKKGQKREHKMNPKGETRRWGNFPGLHSQLSFAGFMENFLLDKTCTLRVFMVWMTPAWSFTVRHQRVLESLLLFHPRACVVVFSETLELRFFKNFVDDGYRVAVVMPNLEDLLKGTPAHVFSSIWMEWRQVNLFYIHYSELLRLAALYRYGGIYLDFDVLILKPLTDLNNTIGIEVLSNGQPRPNGAVMVFERSSPFLNMSMAEFTATYDETLRDWNGAALLDRVVNVPPDGDNDIKVTMANKIHMEPSFSFFPLSSTNISRYFFTPDSAVIEEEEDLLNKILRQSYAVHLWNGLTSGLVPAPDSLVDKLMDRCCLHCMDVL